MKIKKRTIRQLRTVASRFFPDDDQYHGWLAGRYGYGSTLELDESEAREAVDLLNRKLKERRRQQFGRRKSKRNWLSFEQKEYIEGLFRELGIPEGKRQIGFIKKQVGQAKAVDWLSPREARAVITGLKEWQDTPKSPKGDLPSSPNNESTHNQ
jgi:hypothetical protein